MTSPRRSVRHTAFLLPAVAFVVVAPIDFDRSNSIDEMLAPR
jgi:hypothetical protein